EVLALQATSAIARARCIDVRDGRGGADEPNAGRVRLQLVPAMPPTSGPLPLEQTEITPRVRDQVQMFLDDRRLLGSELVLENAAYTWVSVVARVRPKPRANRTRLAVRAVEAIYRYIHPTTGGPDFLGWPFGRELFAGEIYSLLQTVDGVDFIEEVVLHQV